VFVVSHEASLTGAPKIALNLVKQIRAKTNVHLTTILHNGGPLLPEFEAESETLCLDLPREHHPTIHSRLRKLLKPLQKSGKKVLCICNSVESRFIANSVYTRDIPIVYLLHEYPTSYDTSEFQKIYQYSSKMVFPCMAVRNAADRSVPIPAGKAVVHSQGLLDDQFGTRISKTKARKQLRVALGLPEDAFVVLGCGTIDLRKGIDHFISVARTYEELNRENRPVCFCWVGDGPRHPHSAFHYVEIDIANSKQTNIKLVGEETDVEPFFVGADAFLLTSRVDPFPCVIHEAMAAQLPVILFDESGGAIEAVAEDAGLIVPFANYIETCRTIDRLYENPGFAEKVAARGLARVHQKYRFDDYADQIIQLCESELHMSIRTQSDPVSGANRGLRRAA
jgi:glycosyltransferase involved in cell wall biosynthesis